MKLHRLRPLALLLAAVPAFAGVLVNDYPVDGTNHAFYLVYGYVDSDQFTLASPATVDGVNFGAWVTPGDVLQTVDWTISSTYGAGGTVYGSGTAAVSQDLSFTPFTNSETWNVEAETFSFTGLDLSSGSYFLTLQNAAVSNGGAALWDMNDVQTTSWVNQWGSDAAECSSLNTLGNSYTGNCANAFQIFGSTSATPEPAGFALLGSGLALAGLLRRRVARR